MLNFKLCDTVYVCCKVNLKRKIHEIAIDRAMNDSDNVEVVEPVTTKEQSSVLIGVFGEQKGREVRGNCPSYMFLFDVFHLIWYYAYTSCCLENEKESWWLLLTDKKYNSFSRLSPFMYVVWCFCLMFVIGWWWNKCKLIKNSAAPSSLTKHGMYSILKKYPDSFIPHS